MSKSKMPKLSTPLLEKSGQDLPLDLPALDHVVSLRWIGKDFELHLSPKLGVFQISARPGAAEDLSTLLLPDEYVSVRHCTLQRKGNELSITDTQSSNGIFFDDSRAQSGTIRAGQSFRVGRVNLLALDEHLRMLRPHLLRLLGLADHQRTDEALQRIATKEPLLFIGEPGCDQLELARQIHATSVRRGNAFVPVNPPLATEPEWRAVLRHASRGVAFLDLDVIPKLSAPFVRELFGSSYHVRPIIAATSYKQAQTQLGDEHARKMLQISIPPLAERREDIPALLDDLFSDANSKRRIAELGDERVTAITKKKWPRNFEDLRFHAPRLLAYIERGFNKSAAAESLGISASALTESLNRLGL